MLHAAGLCLLGTRCRAVYIVAGDTPSGGVPVRSYLWVGRCLPIPTVL